jgi:hypothetical protein
MVITRRLIAAARITRKEHGMNEMDDGLSEKTWMQLRQCTRIALHYLRDQGHGEWYPGNLILAEMEKVLAEGSTDAL